MAKMYYKDVSLSVGGTDLSAFVESCTVTHGAKNEVSTPMNSGTEIYLPGGVETWDFAINFFQDYDDDTGVEAELTAATAAAVAIVLKPTGAGPSANNPQISGNVTCLEHNPVMGGSGDQAKTPAHFVPAGAITVSRSA